MCIFLFKFCKCNSHKIHKLSSSITDYSSQNVRVNDGVSYTVGHLLIDLTFKYENSLLINLCHM